MKQIVTVKVNAPRLDVAEANLNEFARGKGVHADILDGTVTFNHEWVEGSAYKKPMLVGKKWLIPNCLPFLDIPEVEVEVVKVQ